MDVIERTSVEVTGDSSEYNRSIDMAVAKTKAMIVQQKKLVDSLDKNEVHQKKTAESIKKVTAKYGANSDKVKKLQKGLDTLKASEQKLGSQLRSVNKYLGTQQKELRETDSAAQKTSKTMGNFTKLLIGLGAGYAGKSFLKATIGGVAEFEQYEAAFAVLLGDIGKAKTMLTDLAHFAEKTPLELPQVAEISQLLLSYGVDEKDMLTTLTRLGNLAQGNAEKMDRLSLAYGQMLAKGKVTGEELRQATEAGVPLLQALADSMGVTTAEYLKLQEKGKVSITDLNNAIESLTTGTGKFAGMMEKQSQTMAGLFSTAKDEAKAFAREIGEGAFDDVKSALKDTMDEVDRMKQNGELESIANGWGTAFSGITKTVMGCTTSMVKNREVVGMLVTSYGTLLIVQQVSTAVKAYKTAVDATTTAQKLLNATLAVNPWVALAGVVITVTGGILAFADATREADKKLEELNEETSKIKAGNYDFGSEKVIELQRTIDSTLPSLEEYKAKVEKLGGVSKLSAGDQEFLKQKINDVNGVLGDEKVKIDDHTDSLVINTNELWDNIEALQARAKAEAGYQLLVRKEQEYTEKSLEYQQKKIENNKMINQLKKEQQQEEDESWPKKIFGDAVGEFLDIDLFGNTAGTIDDKMRKLYQENNYGDEYLKSLKKNKEAITETVGDLFDELAEKSKDSDEVFVPPPPTTVEAVKDILKEAYDEQLRIAKDYLTKRKQQIDEEYDYQKQKIIDNFDHKIDRLKEEYEAERNKVNKVIAEIDREIAAKKRAREEEKLDDEINLKTKQISILEQQIEFERNPEEKAELEKELKRQQEALKDLNVEVEVNKLEAEKKNRQERLESIQEEHEEELERLEERKEKKLKDLEEEHKKALKNIDYASYHLKQQLSAVYGYIDTETVATGKRFADVTVNTLDSGFTTVAMEAQTVIDGMMQQVEDAIDSLNRAARRATRAKSDYEDRHSRRSYNDYSDSRSMKVTNHVVQGLTESQVDRLMTRQANRFLYGR